jgi:diguanylate cyclase (GGDEF)-like protein
MYARHLPRRTCSQGIPADRGGAVRRRQRDATVRITARRYTDRRDLPHARANAGFCVDLVSTSMILCVCLICAIRAMPKRRHPEPRKGADTIRVEAVAQPPRRTTGARMGSLLVVQGAEVDLGRHILCDRPIVIGRDENAELTLTDGSISRRHCCVKRDSQTGGYVLVDLGSTNGTTLNGVPVAVRMPLSEGDKVFLGSSVLRFSYSDEFDVEYHSRLEELVSTDALTGLSTKRQYDAMFAAMADRATADESFLTVLVMDMDGLKQINDTHGHEMGGFAISTVAGIIRAVLEPYGIICRYGGDEFVAAMAAVDRDGARSLAEEVRERVQRHDFQQGSVHIRPTLSIGLATYPSDVREPRLLFEAADRALYAAKRAGRNRVATTPPIP